MNSTIKKLLWPIIKIKNAYENYLCRTNPEKLFAFRFRRVTGEKLNIDTPVTLYDKIAHLAFRTDTSRWSVLADKIGVRDFIAEKGYGDNLPKLLGVWDNADKIDYSKLPKQFVLKTNNASATNIIVNDKDLLNKEATNKQLNEWLAYDYGLYTCQPHYSRIKPLILAEELLIDDETTGKGKSLNDYKFFCINGEPTYVMTMTDREFNTHNVNVMVFDLKWQAHPEFISNRQDSNANVERPVCFDKMIEIAKVLSAEFEFVRVDFYNINNTPIFGELTFTPGFSIPSKKFLQELGEKLKI